MPEGPSIVILREQAAAFAGRRVLRVAGNSRVLDLPRMQGKTAVFPGVGNIIKNEVLHRTRVHPESRIGALPSRKLGELIRQAREYSFDFYEWKKAFVLRKHYQVHTRTTCPRRPAGLSRQARPGPAPRVLLRAVPTAVSMR